eukprot:jgi/Chlat1/4761/Chrsp308S04730
MAATGAGRGALSSPSPSSSSWLPMKWALQWMLSLGGYYQPVADILVGSTRLEKSVQNDADLSLRVVLILLEELVKEGVLDGKAVAQLECVETLGGQLAEWAQRLLPEVRLQAVLAHLRTESEGGKVDWPAYVDDVELLFPQRSSVPEERRMNKGLMVLVDTPKHHQSNKARQEQRRSLLAAHPLGPVLENVKQLVVKAKQTLEQPVLDQQRSLLQIAQRCLASKGRPDMESVRPASHGTASPRRPAGVVKPSATDHQHRPSRSVDHVDLKAPAVAPSSDATLLEDNHGRKSLRSASPKLANLPSSSKRKYQTPPSSYLDTEDEEEPEFERDEDVSFNEDVCRECDTGGTLICCDTCPAAYHLDCASLDTVPEGDWFCLECSQKLALPTSSMETDDEKDRLYVRGRSISSPKGKKSPGKQKTPKKQFKSPARKRRLFTIEEVECIQDGLKMFSSKFDKWALTLKYGQEKGLFEGRTSGDLRCKWRNMEAHIGMSKGIQLYIGEDEDEDDKSARPCMSVTIPAYL